MKRSMLIVLIFSSACVAFATNGTRMIGFDALTMGRGGTSVGMFDSPSLMMTNPAGMSFLQGSMVSGDVSLLVPSVQFSNALNNAQGKTNYYPMPNLGYVNHSDQNPLTWGLGVFTQGGMGSESMLNHNLFRDQNGAFVQQKYYSKLALMEGGVSAAYKLTQEFSAGASAHLAYSMMDFEMPYSLSPSVLKGVVNPATGMTFGNMFSAPPAAGGFGYSEVTASAKMSGLKGFSFAGKIGIAWKVNENATLGLSYTSPTPLTFKSGKAHMDMTSQLNDAFGRAVQGYMMQNPSATAQQAQAAVMQQFGQLGIDLSKGVVADYDLQAKLKFPQSIAFGAGIKVSDAVTLAVDLEWINWANAFDKMTLNLSNGNNSNINRMLGNSGTFSLDFPMNWGNAYLVRLGGEWLATSALTLRAGGAFGTNPVPNETVFPVFPAIIENHVTVGASYQISKPVAVHVAYERAFNSAQTASKGSVLAQEYNNSTSQLAENIFHVALTWSLY